MTPKKSVASKQRQALTPMPKKNDARFSMEQTDQLAAPPSSPFSFKCGTPFRSAAQQQQQQGTKTPTSLREINKKIEIFKTQNKATDSSSQPLTPLKKKKKRATHKSSEKLLINDLLRATELTKAQNFAAARSILLNLIAEDDSTESRFGTYKVTRQAHFWIAFACVEEADEKYADVVKCFEKAIEFGAMPISSIHDALKCFLSRQIKKHDKKTTGSARENEAQIGVTPQSDLPIRLSMLPSMSERRASVMAQVSKPVASSRQLLEALSLTSEWLSEEEVTNWNALASILTKGLLETHLQQNKPKQAEVLDLDVYTRQLRAFQDTPFPDLAQDDDDLLLPEATDDSATETKLQTPTKQPSTPFKKLAVLCSSPMLRKCKPARVTISEEEEEEEELELQQPEIEAELNASIDIEEEDKEEEEEEISQPPKPTARRLFGGNSCAEKKDNQKEEEENNCPPSPPPAPSPASTRSPTPTLNRRRRTKGASSKSSTRANSTRRPRPTSGTTRDNFGSFVTLAPIRAQTDAEQLSVYTPVRRSRRLNSNTQPAVFRRNDHL